MRYVEESKAYEMYNEMLDEVSGVVRIGSLEYRASRVLKEVDPIAYDCGFVDFCDAEDITTSEDEADEETEG